MPLVSTGSLLQAAVQRGSAVGAFNVITLEHVEAVLRGAEQAERPVILQISENAVRFHGGQELPLARAASAAAAACTVDAALHLDHVTDTALLRRAADAGFSSVMFDAGAAPYEQNASQTADAVAWAHGAGLIVEAELGYVGGKPDAPASAHAAGVRTDPAEAVEYVERTGVDALAVAVGSSHAMTTRDATLDHSLIARLTSAVDVPLVLHGSSGVKDDDLRLAVAAGMRKVNVGTALNVAYTDGVKSYLAENPSVVDPRKYLTAARSSVATVVAQLLRVIAD
jgi:fructose-bisphosphate aldolase, class II